MVDSTIKTVKENWIILAFIVSLIVTWTQFQSRITSLEARMSTIEQKQDETTRFLSSLDNRLVEIKTTLEFIKNRVN